MKNDRVKSIKIEILGKNYPIKVQESQETTMRKIARYVDQRFRACKSDLNKQPDTTVMTLACLSITEELFEERQSTTDNKQKEEKIFREINQSLKELLDD